MDAQTLARIVPTAGLARCEELIDGYNWCAELVDATTVRRAAMLIAMVAEESASLHALEEYASGAEYNGRLDLGNTQPGDGERFKGRTLIQITGRNNYGRVSRWCHARGLVPTDTYFVDHPAALAHPKFAWVGPAEYWLGDHNHGYGSINAAADANDIVAATYMVNGGQNGIETRRLYYSRALAQGDAILPEGDPMANLTDEQLDQIAHAVWSHPITHDGTKSAASAWLTRGAANARTAAVALTDKSSGLLKRFALLQKKIGS